MTDAASPFPGFHEETSFYCRYGRLKETSEVFSQVKLCFVATDLPFLVSFLSELAEDPDCYHVKFSPIPRDGMHLGRCHVKDEATACAWWAKYKSHPKLMCSVQDDVATKRFRPA